MKKTPKPEKLEEQPENEQSDKKKQEEYEKAEKLVQKRLKEIQLKNNNLDQNKRESIFKMPYSQLIIANSRGGKTYSVYQQLKNPVYRILERLDGQNIYIVSPTWELDHSMQLIVDLLVQEKDFQPATNCFDDVNLGMQTINDRIKQQVIQIRAKKLIPPILVILDDLISEFKTQAFQKWIEHLACKSRHYNLSFSLLSQSHKQISLVTRRNVNLVQICGLNLQTELESVSEEFRGPMTKRQMVEMTNKIVNSGGYNYLLICQQRPAEERFLINGEDIVLL